MAASLDIIMGWMITAPEGAPDLASSDICRLEQRQEMLSQACAMSRGQKTQPLFVNLDAETWGLVSMARYKQGSGLFEGLCALEGLKDGKDYVALGADDMVGPEQIVLLKQDVFSAFLCRAWARKHLLDEVKPLLAAGATCPFDEQKKLVLGSDEVIANHYLELLLGRGPKDRCPQAEKYLQGIARDMVLSEQPYLCTVLEGRRTITQDDTILNIILKELGGGGIPHDFLQDLALVVAVKALQLVQLLGLDL